MTHYFLGNRLLGASAHRPWYSDTQFESCNTVFVCPICGDAWGRIVLSPSAEWAPVRSGCSLHPWPYDVGGSFLHPWLRRLEGLPPEVLVHEFDLRYERLHHGN